MVTVGVTGHRYLSPAITAHVTKMIMGLLREHSAGPLTGISCLAEGADSIFAQIVLDLGGRLVAVIPAADYGDFMPAPHRPTFARLCASADEVWRTDRAETDPPALMAASQRMVDAADSIIAVWDGQPARGCAGTADVVEYAVRRHRPVRVVWPDHAVRK